MTNKKTNDLGAYENISKEALHQNLYKYLDKYLHEYVEYVDSLNARIYKNITISDDLDLEELQDLGVGTIVVMGNLTVGGSILGGRTGTSLFVHGETKAKNLTAGDPIICLQNAQISDFTIGIDNNGILFIKSLQTRILMNFDHDTKIGNVSNIEISYSINYAGEHEQGMYHIKDQDDFSVYLHKEKSLHPILDLAEGDTSEYESYDILSGALHELIKSNNHLFLREKIILYMHENI